MRGDRLRSLRWIVFALAVLAMNFPVIVTFVTSLKTPGEISTNPGLLVESPTLANYARVFAMADRFDILHFLWNSLVASLIGALLALLVVLPAAYAMMRLGLGRRWLLPMVGNIGAIPLIIFAIPLFMMYQQLGLLDKRFGLGLILAVVNIPLTLAILAAAIAELPREIEEAARLDGADPTRILLHIVTPLCRSAIAASLVLGFVTAWNEFLFGLILTTRSAVPVTVGASFFFAASGGGVQWGVAAAVMMLSTLPPVLIGLLMYRRIGRSMTGGALKG
jgi:multiple sugar transport system permease protein